jgi:hypothetical protein
MGGNPWRVGIHSDLGESAGCLAPNKLRSLQIFPVSLFCGLASLNNIAGFLKPLRVFLDAHPKLESVATGLLPVILVALLTLAICPILLVIANKAETIVTGLGVHNAVLNRFWKFCE